MSTTDFNNGLITGLALKGIPYGVTVSWQPKSVTNDDTESITIDFDRNIPDIEIENYVEALYFVSTYIQDQFLITIKGWKRVNQSTIKFLLTDFFSCNGVVSIMYNTKQGKIGALPSFVVNYKPSGIPIIIYKKLDLLLNPVKIEDLNYFSIIPNYGDILNSNLDTPVSNSFTENLAEATINLNLNDFYIKVNQYTDSSDTNLYEPI